MLPYALLLVLAAVLVAIDLYVVVRHGYPVPAAGEASGDPLAMMVSLCPAATGLSAGLVAAVASTTGPPPGSTVVAPVPKPRRPPDAEISAS